MRGAVPHLKTADPVMRRVIETCGPPRITYMEPVFASVARSIVYQQLSTKAARTIYGKLEALLRPAGVTPAALLKLDEAALRTAGVSAQKARYLHDLASKTKTGRVRFRTLPQMTDNEVISHLTQVKGVGVWTAQMFLMFALRRRDVLPTGDLGIQNAMMRLYDLENKPTPHEMAGIAEPWAPYRTVGCWYLWRSLVSTPGF